MFPVSRNKSGVKMEWEKGKDSEVCVIENMLSERSQRRV